MKRHLRVAAVVAGLGLAVSACDYRTTGSPTGDLDLVAEFTDVQHLVVGHTVRLADVPVGSVTDVRLDGYTAVVEMSIADEHDIPVGTTASISATSLLGENYVRLRPPADPGAGIVADGDELSTTGADASFEEMTIKLLTLMRSIQGEDIATFINESHTALAGRGDELHALIGTVDQLSTNLVGQTDDLIAILDSLATFGEQVAADAALLGTSITAAADATGSLAGQRDRMVATVEQLLVAAATLDEEVLRPHREQLDVILDRLTPVVGILADNRQTVIDALDALRRTNIDLPRAIDDKFHDLWAFGKFGGVVLPDGTHLDPAFTTGAGGDPSPARLVRTPGMFIAETLIRTVGGDA